ncbi:hypothetical protein LIER_37217 [Lithospermum erythrorhizon]|uniref:Uncharacterized protein n=1 Tax=Lithospermum erythrorhizon TaxID=34254 RepID=A0AAV3PH16_LITER
MGKRGGNYLIWRLKPILFSRDVVFYESEFPYLASAGSTSISRQPSITVNDCASECSETKNLDDSLVATELEPSVEVVEELTKQPAMELSVELPQASFSVVANYVEQSPAPSRSASVAEGDVCRAVSCPVFPN